MSGIAERRRLAREAPSSEYLRRRQDLVEAGAIEFAQKGYERANLKDIATRLAWDRATVYYYISGKQELFREVILKVSEYNLSNAERIASSNHSPKEKLRLLIADLMHSYEEHHPYLFVYVREDMATLRSDDSALAEELKDISRRYQRAVRGIIEEGIECQAFVQLGDPQVLTHAIIGMVNWTHRWFLPGRRGADEIAETFSRVVLYGLSSTGYPGVGPADKEASPR